MSPYVLPRTADALLDTLPDASVDLFLTDPPYHGITSDAWDNEWPTERAFAEWLSAILLRALPKLTPTGSLVFFGAMGRHGSNRPHVALHLVSPTGRGQVSRYLQTLGL